MIANETIKHRATIMAISTGEMPNVELIWYRQRSEGSTECFGRGLGCQRKDCFWRRDCLALDFFSDMTLAEARARMRQEVGVVVDSVTLNARKVAPKKTAGTLELDKCRSSVP